MDAFFFKKKKGLSPLLPLWARFSHLLSKSNEWIRSTTLHKGDLMTPNLWISSMHTINTTDNEETKNT